MKSLPEPHRSQSVRIGFNSAVGALLSNCGALEPCASIEAMNFASQGRLETLKFESDNSRGFMCERSQYNRPFPSRSRHEKIITSYLHLQSPLRASCWNPSLDGIIISSTPPISFRKSRATISCSPFKPQSRTTDGIHKLVPTPAESCGSIFLVLPG